MQKNETKKHGGIPEHLFGNDWKFLMLFEKRVFLGPDASIF